MNFFNNQLYNAPEERLLIVFIGLIQIAPAELPVDYRRLRWSRFPVI
jgi:hypothetical protein